VEERREITIEDCVEVVLDISAVRHYRQLLARTMSPDRAEEGVYIQPLHDAIAVRSRALIEFFFGHARRERAHPDDLRAGDFVPGWAMEPTEEMAAHLRHLDKHVAHMTLTRSAQRGAVLIDIGKRADELLEVAAVWARQVERFSIDPETWSIAAWPGG
jgi:hypothetical protein